MSRMFSSNGGGVFNCSSNADSIFCFSTSFLFFLIFALIFCAYFEVLFPDLFSPLSVSKNPFFFFFLLFNFSDALEVSLWALGSSKSKSPFLSFIFLSGLFISLLAFLLKY
jgi:hypothetical protein